MLELSHEFRVEDKIGLHEHAVQVPPPVSANAETGIQRMLRRRKMTRTNLTQETSPKTGKPELIYDFVGDNDRNP